MKIEETKLRKIIRKEIRTVTENMPSRFQGSRTTSTKVLGREGDFVLKQYSGQTTVYILENEGRTTGGKLYIEPGKIRDVTKLLNNVR